MNTIRKLLKISWVFTALLLLLGCNETEKDSPCPKYLQEPPSWVSISQGVWGCIDYWQGDFMPGTSEYSGTKNTVVRAIHIFESTKIEDVEQKEHAGFYSSIHSELVAIVNSDPNGLYQIDLPAGEYSFFVEEKDGFYASQGNIKDGINYINLVNVETDKLTRKYIEITYDATF